MNDQLKIYLIGLAAHMRHMEKECSQIIEGYRLDSEKNGSDNTHTIECLESRNIAWDYVARCVEGDLVDFENGELG